MAEENNFFAESLKQLVTKSVEANEVFMKEGQKLLKSMTSKEKQNEKSNLLSGELVKNAFQAFAELNVTYLKNAMDIGISVAKNMSGSTTQKNNEATEDFSPAFILSASGKAGDTVSLQFVLDNVKDTVVRSSLQEVGFCRMPKNEKTEIPLQFTPADFELAAGGKQVVDILIKIPADALAGDYENKIAVKGFEPSYFLIKLSVTTVEAPQENEYKGKRKSK